MKKRSESTAQLARPIEFAHPEPDSGKKKIIPVFTPFAGCPERCVYCSQNLSTGEKTAPLSNTFEKLRRMLDNLPVAEAAAPELAFYGGTFTSLPGGWPEKFTALAGEHKLRGAVSRVRCSTRPDAVDIRKILYLKDLGLDLIELGVQSFDAGVLTASRRGYGPEAIREAVLTVHEAGLALGIQLLPGLPGSGAESLESDARETAAARPECARLYPCLVIEGTELARMWRQGGYEPWALEETVERLAGAVLALWQSDIRVIRVGLAPEASLEPQVLAGPVHSALGQLVRSRALFLHVKDKIRELGREPGYLAAPKRWTSDVRGHRGDMLSSYRAAGLPPEKIHYVDEGIFQLG
jgi:histone acetyltransferase (RNA polymerase elongator complex component)